MRQHLNTLFVTREGAYLAKDGAAIDVRQGGQSLLRVPLHNLDGIVALGYDIGASAHLMAACAEAGVTLSFCTPNGRFLAAVRGFTPGNVLLRRMQYRLSDDATASLRLAMPMIAAKLANCRAVLQRAVRDHGDSSGIASASALLARSAQSAMRAGDLDALRGIEGDAAGVYFAVFPQLLKIEGFAFEGRVRRPPTDPVNALLSFHYSLLAHDCRSALESVGLDGAVGFLHRDRPGRPSLALDLMEEFRPVLADRAALTLLNRRQLSPGDFRVQESGAVELTETARKTVLTAWQERKRDEITHPFLEEKTTVGLLPFLQARLLSRHLRGDLDAYPAFLWR
ncbi:MAG: type I-C CRISPR-associated endonuclease Cas1c [Terrimicrobiaceae bacterium]|nr:type I-C CRISPR-associated endonuclease Cas1c [Terrimicrobiaceae bacterium]